MLSLSPHFSLFLTSSYFFLLRPLPVNAGSTILINLPTSLQIPLRFGRLVLTHDIHFPPLDSKGMQRSVPSVLSMVHCGARRLEADAGLWERELRSRRSEWRQLREKREVLVSRLSALRATQGRLREKQRRCGA